MDILNKIDSVILETNLHKIDTILSDYAAAPAYTTDWLDYGGPADENGFDIDDNYSPLVCSIGNDDDEALAGDVVGLPFYTVTTGSFTIRKNLTEFSDLYPDGLYGYITTDYGGYICVREQDELSRW